jgi:dissimilatory sulfite reductase (desulfoviridin) alpha/beta subunit
MIVKTVMNLQVPYDFGIFLSSCPNGCFSRRAQHHRIIELRRIDLSLKCCRAVTARFGNVTRVYKYIVRLDTPGKQH